MNILLIGGTGTISMAISRRLITLGHKVFLLNRGNRRVPELAGAVFISADVHNEKDMAEKLSGCTFDCAADFLAYNVQDVERDFRLFNGKVKQFIYISSASAYQKPPVSNVITESTPLVNPYWAYSRGKIAGENYLMERYREDNFPVTIVRPSHTYDERKVPLAVHGKKGSFQVLRRMIEGKPVIIHGDGTSLWTLTHNSDFAVGFTGLIGNVKTLGQAVQIMTEENMSWNQIYAVIADTLSVKLNAVRIGTDFLCAADTIGLDLRGELWGDKGYPVQFDVSKLKSLVPEFKQTVPMQLGISSTVKNVLSHKEFQIPDPEFDVWCDKVISVYNTALHSF